MCQCRVHKFKKKIDTEMRMKMKLTTIEGMQSEIFVPVTPKPVFTELKKPLNECRVAFITAGGIHKKSQTPFNTSGDFSYRTIEFSTPSSELMVTHRHCRHCFRT